MLCPACNHKLLPYLLRTKARTIVVEYCTVCGGIWTGQGDVNFLQKEDLAPIDDLLPEELSEPTNSPPICPLDRTPLEVFRGESVPYNLDVFMCPKCHGYFFPHTHLEKLKDAQATKLNYYKVWNIPLPSIYSVMLPVLALLILGGGIIATYTAVTQPQDTRTKAQDIHSTPIVIPGKNSVTISFTTQAPLLAKIRYWTGSEAAYEQIATVEETTRHTIVLSNLVSGATYNYQILLNTRDIYTSQVYTFTAE